MTPLHEMFFGKPDKAESAFCDAILKSVCAGISLDPATITTAAHIEEFDRMTAQGWKLNLLTGRYYR